MGFIETLISIVTTMALHFLTGAKLNREIAELRLALSQSRIRQDAQQKAFVREVMRTIVSELRPLRDRLGRMEGKLSDPARLPAEVEGKITSVSHAAVLAGLRSLEEAIASRRDHGPVSEAASYLSELEDRISKRRRSEEVC